MSAHYENLQFSISSVQQGMTIPVLHVKKSFRKIGSKILIYIFILFVIFFVFELLTCQVLNFKALPSLTSIK